MRKKYLKNIEDVEALRNTDTKIYKDGSTGYNKFVNGVLCFFNTDSAYIFYNVTMDFNQKGSNLYIEVEDEPSEEDIGKLGWFWDDDDDIGTGLCLMDRLDEIDEGRFYAVDVGGYYKHFRPLTPEEVEEYTGYKVVKED